jgi:ketosteroid isomerase-like protein
MLSDEDRHAIETLHQAWLDAELRVGPSALLDLCTPSTVWLPPHATPLCGQVAIRQGLETQFQPVLRRIEIDALTICGGGSFALKSATFRTVLEHPVDNGSDVVTGSHAWLLQRDERGSWRISVVAWVIAEVGSSNTSGRQR